MRVCVSNGENECRCSHITGYPKSEINMKNQGEMNGGRKNEKNEKKEKQEGGS